MSKNIPLSPHANVVADMTKMLADRNWSPESEDDYSALNDAVLFMFDASAHVEKPLSIQDLLDEIIAKTRPVVLAETPTPSYSIDDQLAAKLAERNWVPVTAADVAALDALSREIFETRVFVEPVLSFEAMLTQFIAKNTPPA